MDRATRGTALLVLGAVLLAGTVAVSAAVAPDRAVSSDGDTLTLVGSQGGGPGWHDYGSVYLLDGTGAVWTEDSADSYFDVTMLPNGSVMAGFMHSGYEEGCGPYAAPCTKTGFRIIDPDAEGGERTSGSRASSDQESDGGPSVVSEYAFPVRSESNSEVHDVERLDSGEYLLSDMEHERIVTVKGGEETWEWSASEFYEAPPDPTRRDWLHINDVDVVNESHYLVSVRNANQIVLVERGEGVVEVINADEPGSDDRSCRVRGQLVDANGDGDVRCGDADVLDHQHNPQWLGDGAVLVADSDNDRVVELHRNETTGEWEPAWTLTRAGGIPLHWPRDADRLDDGDTLVTDTLNQRVFEVTPNGTVVWSSGTDRIPYEAERLPEGERAGGVRYNADGADDGAVVANAETDVPGLSLGVVALRAAVPSTPFWFRETQLGLTLLGLGLGVVGLVVRRRA